MEETWPKIEGRPAAQVSMGLHEKIGLPNFSNVDIGPVTITRFCEDTKEVRLASIREVTEECEEIMAEERTKIVQWLKSQGVDV